MLTVTKIFQFEMAHAIFGYSGKCKNIHGHSYELEVSVCFKDKNNDYIPAPGFIIDFVELKNIITSSVIREFDHKLILSRQYVVHNPSVKSLENLITWEVEPTAENLLVNMQKIIRSVLPESVKLAELKLYETKTSYARWKE